MSCTPRWRHPCSSHSRRTRRRPGAFWGPCTSSACCATRRTSGWERSSTTPWSRCPPTPPPPRSRVLLASYNLVSLPVVDQAHRLVGCVSVDDVLDYLLPDDWRTHDSDDPNPRRRSDRSPPRAFLRSRLRPRGGADGTCTTTDRPRRSPRAARGCWRPAPRSHRAIASAGSRSGSPAPWHARLPALADAVLRAVDGWNSLMPRSCGSTPPPSGSPPSPSSSPCRLRTRRPSSCSRRTGRTTGTACRSNRIASARSAISRHRVPGA